MHKRHSFVFTEDIDEFEHNYFSDENVESNQLEAQKQRYFRSKAGEIVTDYYSDALTEHFSVCRIWHYRKAKDFSLQGQDL